MHSLVLALLCAHATVAAQDSARIPPPQRFVLEDVPFLDLRGYGAITGAGLPPEVHGWFLAHKSGPGGALILLDTALQRITPLDIPLYRKDHVLEVVRLDSGYLVLAGNERRRSRILLDTQGREIMRTTFKIPIYDPVAGARMRQPVYYAGHMTKPMLTHRPMAGGLVLVAGKAGPKGRDAEMVMFSESLEPLWNVRLRSDSKKESVGLVALNAGHGRILLMELRFHLVKEMDVSGSIILADATTGLASVRIPLIRGDRVHRPVGGWVTASDTALVVGQMRLKEQRDPFGVFRWRLQGTQQYLVHQMKFRDSLFTDVDGPPTDEYPLYLQGFHRPDGSIVLIGESIEEDLNEPVLMGSIALSLLAAASGAVAPPMPEFVDVIAHDLLAVEWSDPESPPTHYHRVDRKPHKARPDEVDLTVNLAWAQLLPDGSIRVLYLDRNDRQVQAVFFTTRHEVKRAAGLALPKGSFSLLPPTGQKLVVIEWSALAKGISLTSVQLPWTPP